MVASDCAGRWPSLRALSVVGVPPSAAPSTLPTEDVAPDIRTRWLEACLHDPNSEGARRPDFRPWTSLSSEEKYELLHDRARGAFGYVTAYTEETMDELGRCGWSVEHVVPRSHILGKKVGDGENDPNGWVVADRVENSRRSNKPLCLWPLESEPTGRPFVRLGGVDHYVPPLEQRARLARKWLFIRATYADEVDPPSAAQRANQEAIIALVRRTPPLEYEVQYDASLRESFNWSNPLLKPHSERWLDSEAWHALIFGTSVQQQQHG